MVPSLLTAANWPIVGQLCWILGKVMNFIYNFLDNCLPSDNGLVGLSIILYTIFVYTLLLPLTVQQQRTSKMSSVMNPEIQKLQKKYAGKRDQASQMKMQEEMKPQALKRIQTRLVLEAVVKAENIQADDAAVEEQFDKMAEDFKMDKEQIKGMFGEEQIAQMKEDLAVQNAITFLVKEAALTE